MAKERTWELACERMAGRERAMGDAQGMAEGGRMAGEMSPGAWRTRPGQKRAAWASAKAQTRNVKPDTGKNEWAEGADRSGYDDATNVLAGIARTGKQRALIAKARELLAERARDAKFGDVPAERLARLAQDIREGADFLAGVTTGDVNRAGLIAQGLRNIAG